VTNGSAFISNERGSATREVLTQQHRPHSIGSSIPWDASREIFSARRESSGSTAETAVHVSSDGGTLPHTSSTFPALSTNKQQAVVEATIRCTSKERAAPLGIARLMNTVMLSFCPDETHGLGLAPPPSPLWFGYTSHGVSANLSSLANSRFRIWRGCSTNVGCRGRSSRTSSNAGRDNTHMRPQPLLCRFAMSLARDSLETKKGGGYSPRNRMPHIIIIYPSHEGRVRVLKEENHWFD